MKYLYSSVTVLILMTASSAVRADFDVTSREYKLLLNPARFTYQNEDADIENYTEQVAEVISGAISRKVSGTAVLNKERYVTYRDTPGTCMLKNKGYVFRDRVNVNDTGDRDATLKFRSADRFISGYEDLSSNQSHTKTKFEEDILFNSEQGLKIKVSHSTKISHYTKTIHQIGDIYDHFPGFADQYSDIGAETQLVKVSNITLYERRYKGQEIDLGRFDADLVISLWYTSATPAPADAPVIAEASFDYADDDGEYTPKVVKRAKKAFLAMATMSDWVKTDSMTKTSFVYQYQADFCENN
ncbi:hypothetical protein VQ7734_03330 [Vibrio quintilis]|uniref:DUF3857 domain-containing protein n=2 Tax=Vibrio quintilis TaxID=1117707 RepID=A0A1M7YY38_9VIBR|nr:hypothetical protein VQ7734_03330 [Vibrio quintilis]